MKKRVKKNKGITLIALVITVIVMLILAGVVISALTGEGGLINSTLSIAGIYGKASKDEKDKVEELLGGTEGGNQGGNEGGNQGGSEGDPDIKISEEIKQEIKNNAISFPKYSDSNRKSIQSGVEYTADENVWLIMIPMHDTSGYLDIIVNGKTYLFSQGVNGIDWDIQGQSMFPIKKGSTFTINFAAGTTVYSVANEEEFGDNQNVEMSKKELESLIIKNKIGFPKYNDRNKGIVDSDKQYTASENCWLIAVADTDGAASMGLNVNGVGYEFSKGYSGQDYGHPTQSMFPIKKGSVYNVSFSGCTVYRVGMEYGFSGEEKAQLSLDEAKHIVNESTMGFPKYDDPNDEQIVSGTRYTANENIWLILTPYEGGSAWSSLNIDGADYSFYQGYSGIDYGHPTQSMFPIKKGSTFTVDFDGGTLKKVSMY